MGVKEVAAGAEWLDENFPGWEREIDLGTLDLATCSACICGQSLRRYVTDHSSLLGGYGEALKRAGVYEDTQKAFQWAEQHGFVYDENEPRWRELIKERFDTGNLSDLR